MSCSGENPTIGRVAEAESLLVKAAESVGPRLTALVAEQELATIKERHLQRAYRERLEELAAEATPAPRVSPSLSHGLKSAWPALGPFDISLAWNVNETVFGELKCGSDEFTLSACAWDAAKCSFCLRHGVGIAMFLIAAAPADVWESRGLGIELFRDGDWEMADVRRRYAQGFRTWERDGYKPHRVPSHVRTRFVALSSRFAIASDVWMIGVAGVEPIGDQWLEWIPLLVGTSDADELTTS